MKKTLKILIITSILVSCQQKTKIIVSNFNLKTDYSDFKHKMTGLDTLNIFIEHSVCTSDARERIEITKKFDSLKIKSEYFEATYTDNPKWKLVYEKTISKNDTIWDFENFLINNKERMTSKTKKYGRIQIVHKNDTIHLFTYGLGDLFKFTDELNASIEKLYPEYLNKIRPISKKVEIVLDDNKVRETELEIE